EALRRHALRRPGARLGVDLRCGLADRVGVAVLESRHACVHRPSSCFGGIDATPRIRTRQPIRLPSTRRACRPPTSASSLYTPRGFHSSFTERSQEGRAMARLSQVFAPRDREFFDLFEEAGHNILHAADLLDRMLRNYPDTKELARDI